ncbi:MAG TPA: hypothetical protein VN843_36500 [Anaerolineales bacterium]|nr:hypothetical protein [Anaerolineales bacterium]
MPWDIILGAIGGSGISIIVTVVLSLIFAQRIIEKAVDTSARRFESSILQAEEAYKKRLGLEAQIDIHLREKRIAVYEKLWQATSLLPQWPRAKNVTYEQLMKLSQTLRDWYFQEGGMYLSRNARETYGALQDYIWAILNDKRKGVLKPEHYDAIREKCSTLRTELTDDILSRRSAPL